MSDAVTVRPKDWVPFRCRNLRGNLMPEQLDAYRLARFLRERGESEFGYYDSMSDYRSP